MMLRDRDREGRGKYKRGDEKRIAPGVSRSTT